jgi:hypothetical protein
MLSFPLKRLSQPIQTVLKVLLESYQKGVAVSSNALLSTAARSGMPTE